MKKIVEPKISVHPLAAAQVVGDLQSIRRDTARDAGNHRNGEDVRIARPACRDKSQHDSAVDQSGDHDLARSPGPAGPWRVAVRDHVDSEMRCETGGKSEHRIAGGLSYNNTERTVYGQVHLK